MSSAQRIEFLKTVDAAKARVSKFFQGLQGHPKILGCSTEDCFVANSRGAAPKGQSYGSSALILSPRGLNVVIVAHELTHIELHVRVGTFRAWRTVPAWFDEGLAVLVSQDPRYSEAAWMAATQNGRHLTTNDAIRWGKRGWLETYGTARHEVGAWYARAGHEGLMRLIANLKQGEPFNEAISSTTPSRSILSPKACPACPVFRARRANSHAPFSWLCVPSNRGI